MGNYVFVLGRMLFASYTHRALSLEAKAMNSLYDVCFAGQLLKGQELQAVRQKIQKLFNARPETLDKLFSGKTQLVKRGCDKATAEKYRQAMERAGALAIIRGPAVAPTLAEPVAKKHSEPADDDSGFDLAPAGSDVLRPEERTVLHTEEVNISGIELTEAGTDLSELIESTEVAPDTSHLSMGEVGEDIPTLADTRTPLNPDTDGISLTPEGTDFSDCAPPEAEAPALDLSSMEVAAAGSDVLEEQYKKTDQGKAPDTNHISLED